MPSENHERDDATFAAAEVTPADSVDVPAPAADPLDAPSGANAPTASGDLDEHLGAEGAEHPASPTLRRGFVLLLQGTVIAFVLVCALWTRGTSSKVALEPGPTENVVAHTAGDIRDDEFAEHGQILMTTVRVRALSNLELLGTWMPWNHTETADSLGPGGSVAGTKQMEASKTAAANVAVAFVDGPGAPAAYAEGALIVDISDGSPAAAAGLQVGDVIVGANGASISLDSDIAAVTERAGAGATVALDVVRRDEPLTVDVTLDGSSRMGVNVTTEYRGELPVTVETEGVGGASAGAMMTLAFIDALSPGDLTADMILAGTGTISPDGSIGSIRGARHKVRGAEAAGAEVFFVPADDEAEARAAATTATVVAVSRIDDVVAWLCANGATDQVCSRQP